MKELHKNISTEFSLNLIQPYPYPSICKLLIDRFKHIQTRVFLVFFKKMSLELKLIQVKDETHLSFRCPQPRRAVLQSDQQRETL